MVEVKTWLEGFDDLKKLENVRMKIDEAKFKVKRVIVDSSLGSLDNRKLFTDEERARFLKLSDALEDASSLIADKIDEQRIKCVKDNVTGFTEEKVEETENEENEFF